MVKAKRSHDIFITASDFPAAHTSTTHKGCANYIIYILRLLLYLKLYLFQFIKYNIIEHLDISSLHA